jgi:hypothetical protein
MQSGQFRGREEAGARFVRASTATITLPEPTALATLASGVALLMVLARKKMRGVGLGRGWEENPFPSRH